MSSSLQPVRHEPYVAPWGPALKQERDRRRLERVWAKETGRTLPRIRTIVKVDLDKILMPAWARRKAIAGLSSAPDSVWLGRIAAMKLKRLDEEAGGSPWLTVTSYRRCGLCQRVMLGEEAEQRYAEELTFSGPHTTCGPDCVERQRALKARPAHSAEVKKLRRRMAKETGGTSPCRN